MKERVAVADLKANLSRYLRRVKAGEQVVVTERNVPIAELTPLAGEASAEQRLNELAEQNLVRMGTGRLDESFWETGLPDDPDATVRAAVADERGEGR